MVRKPDKYMPEKQIWYKSDVFPHCDKRAVTCPICGYPGHVTQNLNQNQREYHYNPETEQDQLYLRVDYFVHHSHYIADIDRGRHVRCKIGDEYVSANDESITTMYRLANNRNLPEWIKDELGYNDVGA